MHKSAAFRTHDNKRHKRDMLVEAVQSNPKATELGS